MKRFYSLFAALLLMPTLAFAQLVPCESGYTGELLITSPDDIAGDYLTGTPAGDATWPDTSGLLRPGVTGEVVIARSPGGTPNEDPTLPPSDPDEACEDALSNPDEVAGNIALIRRGFCGFSFKANRAQEAGAIGAIIYNDERVADDDTDALVNMSGGEDGPNVTIPVVFASRSIGLQIVSQIEDFENTVVAQIQYDACYDTGVTANEDTGVVTSRELSAAYPNPFASRTQFDLSVEETQEVSVRVFNVLGQEVATLHEGVLPAGTQHTFTFEGASLPAGVYLYRVVGETFASTRQVTLVR